MYLAPFSPHLLTLVAHTTYALISLVMNSWLNYFKALVETGKAIDHV